MKSIADIKAIRDRMQSEIIIRDNADSEHETQLVVGMATCGIQAGSREVFNALIDEVASRNLKSVRVARTGTIAQCNQEPIVEVHVPGKDVVTYVKVDAEKAKKIIADHVIGGNVIDEYTR